MELLKRTKAAYRRGQADALADHAHGELEAGDPTAQRWRLREMAYDLAYTRTYEQAARDARRS